MTLFPFAYFYGRRSQENIAGQVQMDLQGEEISSAGLGGGTPYNGLYGEATPERGAIFRLQVCKRVGISQVEAYKRVRKSVI